MTKATLTSRQRGAAVFAGIIGHLFFAPAWIGLGFLLLGGGILALVGGGIGVANVQDAQSVSDFLTQAGGIVKVLGIIFGVIIGVGILLGFLFSALILKAGRVRKPWATTLSSLGIVALLDVPLAIFYLWIAARLTDTKVSGPVFLGPFVFLLGTIVVGVLVWLWMAWAHRGPALVVERADGTQVTVTDSATVASIEASEPVIPAAPTDTAPGA